MSKIRHDEESARQRGDNLEKEWFLHGMTLVRRHCEALEDLVFLDLGCGNAEWADLLRREASDVQVVGLDYAGAHLQRVREKGYEVISCDLEDDGQVESFGESHAGRFDVITCFEVIEHVFNVDQVLALVHRLLKADGLLFISTPNVGYLGYRIYSQFRGNLPPVEGHHIRFFDEKRLDQTLILNGFDVEEHAHFGAGDFYLDRACGERPRRFKAIAAHALFRMGHVLFRKRSVSKAGLLVCARKAHVAPLGMSASVREAAYVDLDVPQRLEAIERLVPYRQQFYFDDHPGLRAFIDREISTISNDSSERG